MGKPNSEGPSTSKSDNNNPPKKKSNNNWFKNKKYYRRKGGTSNGNNNNGRGEPPPPRKGKKEKKKKPKLTLNDFWDKKFHGFSHYFPPNSKIKILELEKKLNFLINYFKERVVTDIDAALKLKELSYLDINYEDLLKDKKIIFQWSEIETDLNDYPYDVLSLASLALYICVYDEINKDVIKTDDKPKEAAEDTEKSEFLSSKSKIIRVPFMQVLIMKDQPLISLRKLKFDDLGKLVTVRGIVVKMGSRKTMCTITPFICLKCNEEFFFENEEGKYFTPSRCANDECSGKNFVVNYKELRPAVLNLMEYRKITIQDDESFRDLNQHLNIDPSEVDIKTRRDNRPNAIPKSIDCYLFKYNSDRCMPADIVTLCGIVKMCPVSTNKRNKLSLHTFYLEAIAVRNHKNSERTMGGNWFTFTNKDYYAIREIFGMPNLFKLLIQSCSPGIYGHEMVKAGLLLTVFGGTPTETKNFIKVRSDINMLIVGDPGIGKSQMVKFISEVAPRGVYVCGAGSTGAGLTVTMHKENDDYVLEAGALVIADRGICCIDEFDKMRNQHDALLEVMEQQCISLTKSQLMRTVNARTSIIAAANPVGGHYNRAKTVGENLHIKAPLLSRFDLIFIMIDKPDKQMDARIVDHIMGNKKSTSPLKMLSRRVKPINPDASLLDKITLDSQEELDLIPMPLIRKYIAYGKQYVFPKLSEEAQEELKIYYNHLRLSHRNINSTPVTLRQLEALKRLTEARAKLELKEIATREHAKEAIEIFAFGMSEVYDDDMMSESFEAISGDEGILNTSNVRTQTRNSTKIFLTKIQKFAQQRQKRLFEVCELKEFATSVGIKGPIDPIISSLNNQGFLIKKAARTYQLQFFD